MVSAIGVRNLLIINKLLSSQRVVAPKAEIIKANGSAIFNFISNYLPDDTNLPVYIQTVVVKLYLIFRS